MLHCVTDVVASFTAADIDACREAKVNAFNGCIACCC
jgi:hypothetical protein